MKTWSPPGEPVRVHASPNHAREEIFPTTFLERDLSIQKGKGKQGERASPSLDLREHACTWRERKAKAQPMPILESNHKTAKPRHVLIG